MRDYIRALRSDGDIRRRSAMRALAYIARGGGEETRGLFSVCWCMLKGPEMGMKLWLMCFAKVTLRNVYVSVSEIVPLSYNKLLAAAANKRKLLFLLCLTCCFKFNSFEV